MRLLLLLLLLPGLAAAQSLTREHPVPRRPEPPPAVIDFNRPASVPPGVPVPPGYRDAQAQSRPLPAASQRHRAADPDPRLRPRRLTRKQAQCHVADALTGM